MYLICLTLESNGVFFSEFRNCSELELYFKKGAFSLIICIGNLLFSMVNSCELYYRKVDGRNRAAGLALVKRAAFPFSVHSASLEPVQELSESTEQHRTESSYVDQIAELQARLHTANTQIELANITCVKQAEEIKEQAVEREEFKEKVKKLQNENAVLKRRIAGLEPEDNSPRPPRPGPSLREFESLTPRQQKKASDKLQSQVLQTSEERKILPTKLSAYLTYRYSFG